MTIGHNHIDEYPKQSDKNAILTLAIFTFGQKIISTTSSPKNVLLPVFFLVGVHLQQQQHTHMASADEISSTTAQIQGA